MVFAKASQEPQVAYKTGHLRSHVSQSEPYDKTVRYLSNHVSYVQYHVPFVSKDASPSVLTVVEYSPRPHLYPLTELAEAVVASCEEIPHFTEFTSSCDAQMIASQTLY
jgi:hypothetical protein